MAIQLRPRPTKPLQRLSDGSTTSSGSEPYSDSSSNFGDDEDISDTSESESEPEESSYPSAGSDSAVDTSDLVNMTDLSNTTDGNKNSSYSATRLRNIQANKALLKSLDIGRASEIAPPNIKTRSQTKSSAGPSRRSYRLSKRSTDPDYYPSLSDLEEDGSTHANKKRKYNVPEGSRKGYTISHCPSMQSFANLPYVKWDKGNMIGKIPGIPVGALFPYRIDSSRAGLHKPTVAGIHGDSNLGCYSICVSGGYPEDVDAGDHLVFTGSGGRSLKGTKDNPKNLRTAPQDHDMELNRTNQSLISSHDNGKVIRVLRGPKSHYVHAPIGCYRYEGLYKCTQYSYEKGKSGFYVYLFTLERLPGQPELTSLPRTMEDPRFQPIFQSLLSYQQSRKSGSSATPPSSPTPSPTKSHFRSSRASSRSSSSTSVKGKSTRRNPPSEARSLSGNEENEHEEDTISDAGSFSGLPFTPRGKKVVFGYKSRPFEDTNEDGEITPIAESKIDEADISSPVETLETVEENPVYESTPIVYFEYDENEDSDHSTITPDTRKMLSELIDITPSTMGSASDSPLEF